MTSHTDTLALARVRAMSPDARRDIRQRHGLSQSDLARGLECTAAAVHGWESGKRQPTGRLGERYAALLADLEAAQ